MFFTDTDDTQLKIIWCLHNILFQTKKEVRIDSDGKKQFKNYTVRDSQYSFLYINETMQSLEKQVEDLCNKKQPIQPFILGLGEVKTLKVTNFFFIFRRPISTS